MSSRLLIPHHNIPDSNRIQVFAAFVDQRSGLRSSKPGDKAIAQESARRVSAIRIESEADHGLALTNHIRDQRDDTHGHLAEINVGVANFRFDGHYRLADIYIPHHSLFPLETRSRSAPLQ